MTAETFALALAIASVVAFAVVVIAFRERLRQAAKENPPAWPPWRFLCSVPQAIEGEEAPSGPRDTPSPLTESTPAPRRRWWRGRT